ncbi:MAG: hypothetical protein MAGBODY4_01093 [Candidatus Marinimicrobia bacterium]|nr:hypothetical protein [Candidatus Neomarinimicrobiota bacterium]
MSEQIKDKSAGLNGGFEVSKNGLPVNWLMYTPNTVPNSDFKIILDNEEYKEGKQSLRFDVKECEDIGGWHSPGFTNEFFVAGKYEGHARYKISFWIKNNGTKFQITAGGVESKGGEMTPLIEGDEEISDWKLFEDEIEVPQERWLRMQLNILQPGTFWIDDIRIEKV